MNTASSTLWPWIALAGLGAFHGLNPAMGWLFAVALGLHRQSRTIVILALAPIAFGHAAAIAATLLAVIAFGTMLDVSLLGHGVGLIAIGWALWHMFVPRRMHVRIGMQTSLMGLGLWSFMMATAHGAGLMLIPSMLALCVSPGAGGELAAGTSVPVSLAALAVHTGAMLAVIGLTAMAIYHWVGLAFLSRGWINLDIFWSAALAAGGIILLAR